MYYDVKILLSINDSIKETTKIDTSLFKVEVARRLSDDELLLQSNITSTDSNSSSISDIQNSSNSSGSSFNKINLIDRRRLLNQTLEYVVSVDQDGADCILVRMDGYDEGTYELLVKPADNVTILRGLANPIVKKFNLAEQRRETERAKAKAEQVGTSSKNGLNIAIVLNMLANLFLQNIASDGFLLKFSMIIKLLNRIRFINVQYGMALDKFMEIVGDISSLSTAVNEDNMIKHTRGIHGKFFQYGVELEIIKVMLPVLVLYFIIWILSFFVKWWLDYMIKNKTQNSSLIYMIINIFDKLHLMFFTMALMDVTFYGIRTLLHTDLDRANQTIWINYWVSIFAFFMVSVDMFRTCEFFINLRFDKDINQFHNTIFVKSLNEKEKIEEEKRKKVKAKIDQFYAINHEATKRALKSNYHLLAFMLGDFQTVDRRINQPYFKLGLFLNLFRFPIYQIIMVTMQTMPMCCSVVILGIEILSFSLNLYTFCLMNEFWTRVKTLNKMAQNFGLFIFVGMCVYLAMIGAQSAEGVPVPLLIQQAAIFCIIVTVAIEYFFGVFSIGLVVQNLIRGTKISPETKVVRGFTYMKYKELQLYNESELASDGKQVIYDIKEIKHKEIKSRMQSTTTSMRKRQHIVNNIFGSKHSFSALPNETDLDKVDKKAEEKKPLEEQSSQNTQQNTIESETKLIN